MEENRDTQAEGLAEQADTSEMEGKYLTFWTDKQLFAVPIADVVQIVGVQKITEVPEFPSYAKGIINLRGNIIPVVDIRLRFGKPEAEYNEHTCIIVTSISDKLMGFVVDAVEEVTSIEEEEISPPPQVGSDYVNTYLTGVGKQEGKVILLLNTQRILSDEQFAAIESVGFE